MKIAGIIAEYNPFHQGHQYHINKTREITGCDYVIAVMAGNFTQRGDPAALSKWSRARAALLCGADAVFELPCLFAVRTADAFAAGGVAILGGLGADFLSFGTELPVDVLRRMADLRAREPEDVRLAIREGLSLGASHARARGDAYAQSLGLSQKTMENPNAVLAAEYLRAIDAMGFFMEPVAIARVGNYHGGGAGFASASQIRKDVFLGGDASGAIPKQAAFQIGEISAHRPDEMWLYALRACDEEGFLRLLHVREGLESRVFKACRAAGSVEEAISMIKTKRYTRARITRLLTHAVISLTRELAEEYPVPTYARLLGARREAGPLLSEIKRRAHIKTAPNPAKLSQDACFQMECRATDFWALGEQSAQNRRAGREFTEKFVSV